MNRKIRTAIAALAALAALSTVVVPGVASAANRADQVGGAIAMYVAGVTAELEVVPTGDGSATEEDCHEYEVEINELRTSALEYAGELPWTHPYGVDGARAAELTQQADSLEDAALGEGCMIVY